MNTEAHERLAGLSMQYQGDWASIAAAVKRGESGRAASGRYPCITIADPEYPAALRELRYPPWVLFYVGDLSLLTKPAVTIVGSRNLTEYGLRATEYSASILAKHYVIVSGLAKGADGAAHRSALHAGGHTIGVIGSGLDTHYPRENEALYREMGRHELILSEYPQGTGIRKHHFPWRNRILAALGSCVIVTQAALKSGTMCTVNAALELGREVWCYPYPCGSEAGMGCNRLIFQGANILYEESVLEDLIPLHSPAGSCQD